MKIRRKRKEPTFEQLKRAAFQRLAAAGRQGRLRSPDDLKRSVSITDLLRFVLSQDGEERGDRVMFVCPFSHRHEHGDENPSLWATDDYRDSGFGRFGCICGLGRDEGNVGYDALDVMQIMSGFDFKESRDFLAGWIDNRRRQPHVSIAKDSPLAGTACRGETQEEIDAAIRAGIEAVSGGPRRKVRLAAR